MGGEPASAFEAAVAALARKERGAAELEALLAGRGFDPAEVQAAVARLLEVGELDDGRFARRFAQDKRELRDWGTKRIRAALLARGLGEEAVEAALGESSSEDEVERARELLARRGAALATERDRARALGLLTRRGYGYEVAYEAVRRAA